MAVKSWSYSQLSAYKQCPHKWMYQRVVKLQEPPSWHLTNGNFVHSLAENFLLGKIDELPSQLNKFKKEFINLRDMGAQAELPRVYNNKWSFLGGEEAWMHDEAWLRLKIDAAVPGLLIDFKTGKEYAEHIGQGRLYANAEMANNSEIDEVDVEFWYLNSGKVAQYTFYRQDLANDVANWEEQVKTMHNDTEFKPKENAYCKYCYVKDVCTLNKS